MGQGNQFSSFLPPFLPSPFFLFFPRSSIHLFKTFSEPLSWTRLSQFPSSFQGKQLTCFGLERHKESSNSTSSSYIRETRVQWGKEDRSDSQGPVQLHTAQSLNLPFVEAREGLRQVKQGNLTSLEGASGCSGQLQRPHWTSRGPSTLLPTDLFICLSGHLSIHPFFLPAINLSFLPSIHPSIFPSIHPSNVSHALWVWGPVLGATVPDETSHQLVREDSIPETITAQRRLTSVPQERSTEFQWS